MDHKAMLSIDHSFRFVVTHPDTGPLTIQLDRIAVQRLAAALRYVGGAPVAGVVADGAVKAVFGLLVTAKRRGGVVRLAAPRGGATWL